jgi:serine/threonine protein kinase
MGIAQKLFCVALEPVLGGFAGTVVESASDFLNERFTDQSQKVQHALHKATGRTWQVLEMALAGDSLWQRCKSWLAPGEEKAFQEQLRGLLQITSLPDLSGKEKFRRTCLAELQAARRAGLLTGISADRSVQVRPMGAFSAFADPVKRLEAEFQMVVEIAADLQKAGHKNLGWLLGQRPTRGEPLLTLSVRYFFRREIESDASLARSVTFSRLEDLAAGQQAVLNQLTESLRRHGQQLQEQLDGLLAVAVETRDNTAQLLQMVHDLRQEVHEAVERNALHNRPVRHGDSMSIHNDVEKKLVHQLLDRFRALPPDQQKKLPDVLNGLGKLKLAVGEHEVAQKCFVAAAQVAPETKARAEAHYNAYRAALERKQYGDALKQIQAAYALDPQRFAPFPLGEYEPVRILGAGGFGVTFHCKLKRTGGDRAVKSLLPDGAGRDVDTVLREASALEKVSHPAVISLKHLGYADEASRSGPYLAMEFFDGLTLEEWVKQNGTLSVDDLGEVAGLVGGALKAAHARGLLHRDVKPANILLRREEGAWQVKLIDFGLAVQAVAPGASTAVSRQTGPNADEPAGTFDYAAPEQMGRVPGVHVGVPADVFGFARTCCFALFQTPNPRSRHWQEKKVPQPLQQLLETCLEEAPERRPRDFGTVLEQLHQALAPVAVIPLFELDERDIVDDEPPPLPVLPVARPRHQEACVRFFCPGQSKLKTAAFAYFTYGIYLMTGASFKVYVNGKLKKEGLVRNGFDLEVELPPGEHVFEVALWNKNKEDARRKFTLPFPKAGEYEVRFNFPGDMPGSTLDVLKEP